MERIGKVTITHIDGITKVKGNAFANDDETVSVEYKLKGMHYSVTYSKADAARNGIINKSNNK